MVHYSVLIPQRDAADDVGQRLPQLCQTLDDLLLPYEIICIDDASSQPAIERLQELLRRDAHLRILRFDEPRGLAAALTAGMAAARGRIVMAMGPREHQPLVSQLLSRLSRYDVAVTSRQGTLIHDTWQCLLRWVRLLTGSSRLHAGEELLWAAKRPAVQGMSLAPGSFRCFEALMARRGQRVCRVTLADGLLPQGTTYHAGIVDRLAAWWFARRFEPHLASELPRDFDDGGATPDSVPPRLDVAQPRPFVQPFVHPVEKKPHDSA